MRQNAPIIRLENVAVDIHGQRILSDITLTISPGEHWGLIGANGSGKSTLLALIAGLRWPVPGNGTRIYDFGDGPERDAVTARQRITLLGHELQDTYVARGWNFRARDVVHSGITRTDIPRRNPDPESLEAAEALLEQMNLGPLAGRRLLDLSRGEQRRVLIARALAFEPALLLLDEPASGLDTASRAGLEETLERAARQTQCVIATHRIDELPGIVNRVATISAGRLSIGQPTGAGLPADAAGAASRPASAIDAGDGRSDADSGGDTRDDVVIALESASVWLGQREVLSRLNWQLRPGENWLITGANGAGKSTFLRLLHAQLRPARGGVIRWPGLGDPRNVWTLRRKVALVSAELQAQYRLPTTVFDAIASGFDASIGLTRKLTGAERERVGELIEDFELEPFRDRLLTSLSYGQRHRCLIARTLAPDPQVLLLDEPWEGLDADTAALIARQLTRRIETGTQVVCVSHLGGSGLPLNRALVLEAGRIVSAGDSA